MVGRMSRCAAVSNQLQACNAPQESPSGSSPAAMLGLAKYCARGGWVTGWSLLRDAAGMTKPGILKMAMKNGQPVHPLQHALIALALIALVQHAACRSPTFHPSTM